MAAEVRAAKAERDELLAEKNSRPQELGAALAQAEAAAAERNALAAQLAQASDGAVRGAGRGGRAWHGGDATAARVCCVVVAFGGATLLTGPWRHLLWPLLQVQSELEAALVEQQRLAAVAERAGQHTAVMRSVGLLLSSIE